VYQPHAIEAKPPNTALQSDPRLAALHKIGAILSDRFGLEMCYTGAGG
jgi:hypothetical protein